MARRRSVVGIDLGTSGVKVLVVGLDHETRDDGTPDDDGTVDGRVLGRGRAEYPVLVPSAGRAESDPGDWWRAVGRAVRQAVAQARDAQIVGLAVAGQMHGLVLARAAAAADDDGTLRPAILWLDQRAALEAGRYAELPPALTVGLGNRPSAGMAGPVLCWLARHEPGNVAAARWALQPKDWIRLRMTGEAATDPTDASGTLLFDLERGAWADDLIAALGLPRDKLPPVRGSARPSGTLLPGPAAELGLPPGIAVAAGAADTAAALYAAGLAADEAMLTLGSGGQWAAPENEFRPTSRTNLYRAVGDGYYRLAPVQNVGVSLNWVRTLLNVSWAELYDAAWPPGPPGRPGLRALPDPRALGPRRDRRLDRPHPRPPARGPAPLRPRRRRRAAQGPPRRPAGGRPRPAPGDTRRRRRHPPSLARPAGRRARPAAAPGPRRLAIRRRRRPPSRGFPPVQLTPLGAARLAAAASRSAWLTPSRRPAAAAASPAWLPLGSPPAPCPPLVDSFLSLLTTFSASYRF